MKLPNRQNAFIPLQKLTDYLLAETHAVGKSKARFFRAHGFQYENVASLAEELLALARENEIEEKKASPHGT